MSAYLLGGGALFYLLATLVCLRHMLKARGPDPCQSTAPLWLLLSGFVLHGMSMGVDAFAAGTLPVAGPVESMSFFAWLTAGLFLLVSLKYRLPTLGAFVAPTALSAAFASLAFHDDGRAVPEALRTFWFPLHVVTIFIGQAAFAISFAMSVAFLIQEYQIRRKTQLPLVRRLPPLEVLDEIIYRSVAIGFPFMTLGMVTGSLWAKHAWGMYWSWDPRLTLALATWALVAGVLHARLAVGWRGRRMALLTIAAFALTVVSFLVVNGLRLGRHVGDFK
ncbi:MAG: c-type cytochrome biogenesis protein CcsB [Deltaproteobacteria bacterium]|nr:c-type cytochrome biogenesis protein CcsB [Deltaproteobacteria bacterium]